MVGCYEPRTFDQKRLDRFEVEEHMGRPEVRTDMLQDFRLAERDRHEDWGCLGLLEPEGPELRPEEATEGVHLVSLRRWNREQCYAVYVTLPDIRLRSRSGPDLIWL